MDIHDGKCVFTSTPESVPASPRLFSTFGVLVVYVASFLAVYLSVIVTPYAFSDDYSGLRNAMTHQVWAPALKVAGGGRPLYALLQGLVLPLIPSLGGLRFLRVLGIVNIGFMAFACHIWLSRARLPRVVNLGLPAMLGLMPPFQVYAAWATAAFFPLSALLSGLAFALLEWAPADARVMSRSRLIAVVAILTAALTIYQPSAMFFWVFAAIAWIGRETPIRWLALIAAVGTMSIALAIDFALAKLLPHLLWGPSATVARTALTQDVAGKLVWFVSEPLPNALNLLSIRPSAWVAGGVTLFAVCGLWLYRREPTRARLVRMSLAMILVPAAYLPNLLVSENWASYRTEAALTSLLLVCTTFGLMGWLRFFKKEGWLPAVVGTFVAICAVAASRNATLWFALPQSIEYRMVSRALDDPSLSGARGLSFYTSERDSLTSLVRYDEFGYLSSFAPWVPTAMAWIILHEEGSPLAGVPMKVVPRGTPVGSPETRLVDLDAVLFAQPRK
jgi:hypothetical protein